MRFLHFLQHVQGNIVVRAKDNGCLPEWKLITHHGCKNRVQMMLDFDFTFTHPFKHFLAVVVNRICSTGIDNGTGKAGKADLVQFIVIDPLQLSGKIEARFCKSEPPYLIFHYFRCIEGICHNAGLHTHNRCFRHQVIALRMAGITGKGVVIKFVHVVVIGIFIPVFEQRKCALVQPYGLAFALTTDCKQSAGKAFVLSLDAELLRRCELVNQIFVGAH